MPDRWPFPLDDPYPAYAEARRRAPVAWDDGLEAWLVLDHRHARAVLAGDAFSADPAGNARLFERLGGHDPGGALLSKVVLFTDPPEHDRLRRVVSRWFSPRQVTSLRGRVAELVEAAWPSGGGAVDVMEELARPLPLAVIAGLLDVGPDVAAVLLDEAPALVAILDPLADEDDRRRAAEAATATSLALIPVIADRVVSPGDDLTSTLLEVLQPPEVVVMMEVLLAAGSVTTANLVGTTFWALADHGEHLSTLRAHPELAGAAVEELLRWEGPAQLAARVAARPVELGGCAIAAGDPVFVVLGAANRDPAVYVEPDRLDLTRFAGGRRPPPSLAFGHGAHACLGAALARLEATEVLARLATGGPWEVVGWERAPSSTFRTWASLTAVPPGG